MAGRPWTKVLARLEAFGFEIVPVSPERAVRASLIKLTSKIPYADAFGVELAAESSDRILVTADFDLKPATKDVEIRVLTDQVTISSTKVLALPAAKWQLFFVSVVQQIQKRPMDPSVFGKLGVKSRRHCFSLPYCHGVLAFGRDDFDSGSDAFDFRGADEHHFNG